LTRAYGRTVANAILKTLSETVQPRYARCGILARLSQDEVLLVLSRGAAATDAAVAVLGGIPSRRAYAAADWPAERVAANHEVPLLTEEAKTQSRPLLGKSDIRVKSRAALRPELFDAQLGDAINRHALGVHYQPQFSLKDGRACGVEALARWTLNSGETLQPAAFIPLAERSGLIGALGATILKSACATAAGWLGQDAAKLTLSVNVSLQQMDAKYARVLESVLNASGFAPERLELKVPERALSVRASAFDCLRSWKSLGVRVAVNHDGADYSALSYLSRVTVDRLKLNRNLVHRMLGDGRVAVLVRAVIALGAELGVEVMAEGVETEDQYALLQELGCTHAQGYLLARPMPAVQAQLALRRPWGNLPREQVRAGGARIN
jgi:EAL domain-containing protein (putative c-di-GMP-specific phosphodiesterase class I)